MLAPLLLIVVRPPPHRGGRGRARSARGPARRGRGLANTVARPSAADRGPRRHPADRRHRRAGHRPLAAPVSRADARVNLYRAATPDGWYHMGATISADLSLNWVCGIMNATWEELYASAAQPGLARRPDLRPAPVGGADPLLRPGAARLVDRAGAGRRPDIGLAQRAGRNRVRDPRCAGCPARPRSPGAAAAGGRRYPARWLAAAARRCAGGTAVRRGRPRGVRPGAALLGAAAAGLLSFDDIAGPLAPVARLAAEPDPAVAGFTRSATPGSGASSLLSKSPPRGHPALRRRGKDRMTALNEQTLAQLNDTVSRPRYDRSQVTTGIVHISVGNFHRSHQAMYIDTLMNNGMAMGLGDLRPRPAAVQRPDARRDGRPGWPVYPGHPARRRRLGRPRDRVDHRVPVRRRRSRGGHREDGRAGHQDRVAHYHRRRLQPQRGHR